MNKVNKNKSLLQWNRTNLIIIAPSKLKEI